MINALPADRAEFVRAAIAERLAVDNDLAN